MAARLTEDLIQNEIDRYSRLTEGSIDAITLWAARPVPKAPATAILTLAVPSCLSPVSWVTVTLASSATHPDSHRSTVSRALASWTLIHSPTL